MFKSGLLFHLMGSFQYVIWQRRCYNSWRTAPGLLHCLQSPAQCSTVLWIVINPVWLILRRVMASCKIFIHPYPTLAGFETFSNETLTKERKKRNLEPGNETVPQSKQKLDLYSFALPGLTDFRLLRRKGLKMSERTPTCQRNTTNTPEEEESILVTCVYGRRLIFPVGSHRTVWTHPFREQFVFLCNFKWDIRWDILSQLWEQQIQSIKPSTRNEEACLHGEWKGITTAREGWVWLLAALLVVNPAGVGLSNTNRGSLVWLCDKWRHFQSPLSFITL